MNINLTFTAKGKIAIDNFTNEELLEIFNRYSNTLRKKYSVDITYPLEWNQNIGTDGVVKVTADKIECDIEQFFKELGRDIKVPLKKRLQGNLDNVFKIVRNE
ncbi:hypothetical protein [Paenibacillus spongiae]|uniref:Uncharacterized protein n=1 Tax=Paenibacillus spongiae TaxID=2909671 RepID=A0ABY5SBK3_9BACL|nr:hypothetical protein [Paenibacillus spongiae]UVI31034.1 hypothetical protein L1F29_04040 [Paenibacillus spongiae]